MITLQKKVKDWSYRWRRSRQINELQDIVNFDFKRNKIEQTITSKFIDAILYWTSEWLSLPTEKKIKIKKSIKRRFK